MHCIPVYISASEPLLSLMHCIQHFPTNARAACVNKFFMHRIQHLRIDASAACTVSDSNALHSCTHFCNCFLFALPNCYTPLPRLPPVLILSASHSKHPHTSLYAYRRTCVLSLMDAHVYCCLSTHMCTVA